jgi:hypothetical protein
MANISASVCRGIFCILLLASRITCCMVGAWKNFVRGLQLVRYVCQSLKICTVCGCRALRSFGAVFCSTMSASGWG